MQHDVHERFGLSLLHKHFDLYPDEILLRSIDRDRRVAYTRPGRKRAEATPYLWRILSGARGQWRVVPLEALRGGAKSERSPDVQEFKAFLADLGNVLTELGLIDLFGVTTLSLLTIPVGPDELLVETTDATKRALTHRPEDRGNIRIEDLTETFWTFTPGEKVPDLGGVAYCKGAHCIGHCKNHCYGHCVGHCKNHPQLPEDVAVLPAAGPVGVS